MAEKITKIGIKADARGLKDLRKELAQTFSGREAKEMNKEFGRLQKELARVTKEQINLNKAMEGIERGTEQYEKMSQALRDVEKDASRLESAMSRIQKVTQQPTVVTPPRHMAFTQGFLQGAAPGTHTFLQRGEGMQRQAAGQMMGRAVRGAGSRAAGLIQGGGPISTVFRGVPILEGMGQMAESQVEAARARSAARLEYAPFAQGDVFGAVGKAYGSVDVPEIDKAKIKQARQAAFAAQARIVSSAPAGGTKVRAGMSPDMRGFLQGAEGAAQLMTPTQAADAAEKEERDKQQKIIDARLKARSKAVAKAIRKTMGDTRAIGLKGGYTETESTQMRARLARAVGGMGETDEMFAQTVAAKRMFGVGEETAGQLWRQQQEGRGGMSALGEDMFASAVARGMQMVGIRDLEAHLSTIAQLQEQAAQQGIKVSTEGVQMMGAGLQFGAGLSGLQAGRLAGQFQGFGQRTARGGAQGPASIALLSAAGFRPGMGSANYLQARKRVENLGQDPELLFQLMQNVMGGMEGMSPDEIANRELVMGGFLQEAGVTAGLGQISKMTAAFSQAGGGTKRFREKMMAEGLMDESGALKMGPAGTAKGLAGQLDTQGMAAMTGALRSGAHVQNRLADAGAKLMPTVDKLNISAANLANSVAELGPVIDKHLVPGVTAVATGLGDLIERFAAWADGQSPLINLPAGGD